MRMPNNMVDIEKHTDLKSSKPLDTCIVLRAGPLANFYPIALRKAKIVYNFGLFECDRVNDDLLLQPAPIISGFKSYWRRKSF